MISENSSVPPPPAVAGFAFVRRLGGIYEYVLEANGLKVLVRPDHSSPTATFMVTYLVGSRNEGPGVTGATHFLEHLMFKDTEKFTHAQGNRVEQFLETVGGQYNATTWLDRTNYYATVGREELDGYMAIEAGRMRGLLLKEDDRKTESTVILDELERGQSHPPSKLSQEVNAAAFCAHPYHHPVIGWASDVAAVTAERLRRFYDEFYWPDNAVASVIGDVGVADALALVGKHYGAFPKAPRPIPEMKTEEPVQTGPRRVTVRRGGELGLVLIAHKSPSALHPDTPALALLSDILGDGKNSRLYRALVDKGLATSVGASPGLFRDPSLHKISATLVPGTKHARAEAVMLREVEKLKATGVTARELQVAVAKSQAQEAYGRDGSFAVASRLNECIAAGDWTSFVTFIESLQKVTPEDVHRVARRYLVEDQSTIGWFVPVSAQA